MLLQTMSLSDGWARRATLLLITICLIIVYAVVAAIRTRTKQKRLQKAWGCAPVLRWPSWDPLLGTDFFLRHLKAFNNRRLLDELHSNFSKIKARTFQLALGGDNVIWTMEAENIQHILTVAADDYCMGSRRQDTFTSFHGLGVFTLEGVEWRKSRKTIRSSLERIQRTLLERLDPHIDSMIEKTPRDGSVVDLQRLFELSALDTITEFLWGKSTKSLDGKEESISTVEFEEAIFRAQEGTGRRFNYGWFRFLLTPKQYWRDVKYMHDFIDARVKESCADEIRSKSATFLNRLINDGHDLTRIRGELLQILMAGRDTTAALLSNAWFEIARHPGVFQKLQREAMSINADKITVGQLKAMPCLQAVLSETLRLYPPIPYNVREAKKDLQLPKGGGPNGDVPAFVPKGAVVAWSIYSLQRRSDVYGDDADDFRPERWLSDEKFDPGSSFLPFNGGERTCPGQAHAMTEAGYTTYRLLREFEKMEWKDSNRGPWQEFLTLSCTNRRGCKVAFS